MRLIVVARKGIVINMNKRRIIVMDKKIMKRMIDEMILHYKDDKEFSQAIKWLDKTKFIKGDFYDKVIQLVFFSQGIKKGSRIREDRMKDFMKNLTRKEKK